MELLKKSLGIKIGLFALLQIFVAITLLAGAVVAENLSYDWYSKSGQEVKRDLLEEFNIV